MNYEKVFERLPNAYTLVKANAPHFTILNVADYHLRVLKKERREIIGRSLFDVFPPASLPNQVEADLLRIIETKASYTVFTTLRYDVTGEEMHWRLEYVPVLDKKNENVEMIIIHSLDITGLTKDL